MLPVKNCKSRSNKRGFSMMEVIFSVFVMSVGLVATISLISSSISNSIDSRNYIIASQLAQEGVELIRNIRDNNIAQGNLAFDNLSGDNYCRIDYDDSLPTCSLGAVAANYDLYYDANFYVHVGTSKRRFNRRIAIIDVDSDTKNIMSIVSWDNNFKNVSLGECTTAGKCIYASAILTRWEE